MPFSECIFVECREPVAFEGIGTYDRAFGLLETVVFVVCEHHADRLVNRVVLLETA